MTSNSIKIFKNLGPTIIDMRPFGNFKTGLFDLRPLCDMCGRV